MQVKSWIFVNCFVNSNNYGIVKYAYFFVNLILRFTMKSFSKKIHHFSPQQTSSCNLAFPLCGNCGKLLSHYYGKNLVKVTLFLHKITTELIWPNIFLMRVNFSFFHSVHLIWRKISCRKNKKNDLTKKRICQINYLVNPLIKTLFSRNFCQKRVK